MTTAWYQIGINPANRNDLINALASAILNAKIIDVYHVYGYTNSFYTVDLTIDDLTVLYLKIPIVKHIKQRKFFQP